MPIINNENSRKIEKLANKYIPDIWRNIVKNIKFENYDGDGDEKISLKDFLSESPFLNINEHIKNNSILRAIKLFKDHLIKDACKNNGNDIELVDQKSFLTKLVCQLFAIQPSKLKTEKYFSNIESNELYNERFVIHF